jgi:hypothetical protein
MSEYAAVGVVMATDAASNVPSNAR